LPESSAGIQQIPCVIRHVCYLPPSSPCDRCQQPAPQVWTVTRTAIDIDLDQPVLLAVEVSVHHCAPCQHFFRAQPPFLRPDAIYTNRVVQKAVEAVFQDGLAVRRVTTRLARDFWVRPSAKMIREWCSAYAQGFDFDRDYLPWVVETFSGVLCVDEVYQDKLALLLAVDPAAPDGDRLVGYQVVAGTVDQAVVASFLNHLQAAGIRPDQVITDGAAMYPPVLAQVWPAAAHQLCLFHETRRVTTAVDDVAKAVRKTIPTPPPPARLQLGGRPRTITPPTDALDSATDRWRWRTAHREAALAQVHTLRERGLSHRAIARETGLNRRTVSAWLKQAKPAPAEGTREIIPPPPPPSTEPDTAPPAPWSDWDEVRAVRTDLMTGRSLLLCRPDHLRPTDEGQLRALLDSPVGADLRVARHFLIDWYAIWRDEAGGRRDLADAQERYATWHANAAYARLAPLRRVQQSVDPARFGRLSQFLRDPFGVATNNGAERTGRTFRHRQRPHFNLRTKTSIEEALKVRAGQRKEAITSPPPALGNRCPRGRPSRRGQEEVALPIAA
jgi:hypothetical protein